MRGFLPILMLGLAGLLVGGAISLRRQGARWPAVIGLALLSAVAALAGILWMPGE